MKTEINTAKNKFYKDMSNEEKIAFAEAVCIYTHDVIIKSHRSSTPSKAFFKDWMERIVSKSPSASDYMKRYFYQVVDNQCHLSVVDDDGALIDLSENIKEVKYFVFNVVNDVPSQTPIINRLNHGKKKLDIVHAGIDTREYGSQTDVKSVTGKKDSLRQRILRGEITKYAAYDKPRIAKNKVDGAEKK